VPERVQLRRSRGWRKPADTIVVARPSRWGNPFTVAEYGPLAVQWFRRFLAERRTDRAMAARWPYPSDEQIRAELAGHNLACWCPLPIRTRDEVAAIAAPLGIAVPEHIDLCHADVLLRVAAGGAP
jgi:Domain of unknown function (DUF4326)